MSPRRSPAPVRPVTVAEPVDDRPEVVRKLLEQYGKSGYRVTVMRSKTERGKSFWENLGRMDLTMDLEEDVRQEHGGGDYRCLTIDSDNSFVKGATIPFKLGGPPKKYEESSSTTPAQANDQVSRLERQLEEIARKQNDGGVERVVAMITGIAAAVGPIITPLLTRGSNSGGDVVGTLQLVHDARMEGKREGELMGKLMAGGAGEESLLSIGKQFIGPILGLANKVVEQRAGARAPNPPAPVAIVPPGGTPVETPAAAAVLAPEYAWLAAVRPHIPKLAHQAAANTDPSVVADFVLSQLDATLFAQVEATTKREDFLPTMRAEFATIVATHSDWVEEYLQATIDACAPEETGPALVAEVPAKKLAGKKGR